jgi:hypothetical protein
MSAVLCRSEAADAMEIEGDLLLLHRESFAVTRLNGMGGRIWTLLEERRTLGELVEQVASENEETPVERIREDLQRFVSELEKIGLVRLA